MTEAQPTRQLHQRLRPLLRTLAIIAIAFAGKIIGSGWGTRLGGFTWRESLAAAFGMNARGAMEIILGLVALENGLICLEFLWEHGCNFYSSWSIMYPANRILGFPRYFSWEQRQRHEVFYPVFLKLEKIPSLKTSTLP